LTSNTQMAKDTIHGIRRPSLMRKRCCRSFAMMEGNLLL